MLGQGLQLGPDYETHHPNCPRIRPRELPAGVVGAAALEASSVYVQDAAIFGDAFQQVMGRAPTASEWQWGQAVGEFETFGGRGRHPNNWGGLEPAHPDADGKCPPGTELGTDKEPLQGGGSRVYATCYSVFPTSLDGCAAFVRQLYLKRPSVLAAARSGSAIAAAAAMYDSNWYKGISTVRAEAVDAYARGVAAVAGRIARAMGQPAAVRYASDGLTAPATSGDGAGVLVFLLGLLLAALGSRVT